MTFLQRLALSPQRLKRYSFLCALWSSFFWLVGSFFLLRIIFSLPDDCYQKEHVKMLFLHVPVSFLSLALYTAQAIGALLFLIWPLKPLKQLIVSTHFVTLFFVLHSLISGSLWGYPTWGTWWAWDARMTSQLVLCAVLCLQAIILRAPVGDKHKVFSFYCLLLLVGWVDIPIVHYSVTWWNTLHQGYSLSLSEGIKIDSLYLYPLLWSIALQSLWALAMVCYSFSARISVQCTQRTRPILYYGQQHILLS